MVSRLLVDNPASADWDGLEWYESLAQSRSQKFFEQ